jgi:hypothetical protein
MVINSVIQNKNLNFLRLNDPKSQIIYLMTNSHYVL